MVLHVPGNKTEDDCKQWTEQIGMLSEPGGHLKAAISFSHRPGPLALWWLELLESPRHSEDVAERTMPADLDVRQKSPANR